MTSVGWTPGNNEGYLTITGHEVSEDFKCRSFVLATKELDAAHTGDNIGTFVKDVCTEFGISVKTHYITTDNAANMGVAADAAGICRVRCFSHTLQLAVRDGLDKVGPIHNLVTSARCLTKTIKKSARLDKSIEIHQEQLGKQPKGVLRDVPTRWNSSFMMLERLLDIKTDIVSVLHEKEHKKTQAFVVE